MNEQNNGQLGAMGCNIWWTVPGLVVPVDGVGILLERHGFQKADIRPPSERVEVSRAAYSMQDLQGKTNRRKTEKVVDDGGRVIYGILNREDANEQAAFKQKTTVTLTKGTGAVGVDGELVPEVREALETYKGAITSEDVRAFLSRLIRKCHGIAKRPTGGIYFIPASGVETMERAKAFLTELDSGARLYVERVVDGVQERANLWDNVEDEVDASINKVLAQIELVTRVSSVKSQQFKLDGVNELVGVYRNHVPTIALPPDSEEVLRKLRAKYALALLTDGFLPAQQLKVQALGIEEYFASIVYTEQLGRESWKPSPAGFEKILHDLGGRPENTVYVADNEQKDFIAPNRMGFATVQLLRPARVHTSALAGPGAAAHHVISQISELPALVETL